MEYTYETENGDTVTLNVHYHKENGSTIADTIQFDEIIDESGSEINILALPDEIQSTLIQKAYDNYESSEDLDWHD